MLYSSQMFGSRSSEQGHERMVSELVHSGSPQMAQMSLPPVDPILNHIDMDQVSVKELAGDSCLMLEAASKAHMSQMHVSGNLMRYHSAPSSMLAGIVDEFFCKGSTHLSQVADVEFAQQFLADDVSVTSNHCDTAVVQTITSAPEGQAPHQQCEQQPELRSIDQANHIKVEHQQSRFRTISGNGIAEDVSPLSAIFQHSQEGNSDNFGSSMMAIPCKIPIESSTLFPATGYTPTSHAGSNLIRHNSSPGGLLSRIATEILESNCVSRAPVECSPYRNPNETVFASAANGSNLVSAFGLSNCHNGRISNKENNDLNKFEASKSGILRQSSSPAGLLSQLSLEGIMEDGNALGIHSPSQRCFKDDCFDRKEASAFLQNFGGAWDDAFSTSEAMIHGVHNNSTFAARKRNRYLNAKMFSCSQLSDCMEIETLEQGVSLQGQVTLPTVTSPESQLTVDKGLSDAVLCRARAKRGYATHPRSIAERVRRTKISERMKKLQELVPNMDKQTNTAEMLDEAVEYIKSLQRQIQELSEKQSSCDGSCRQK